MKELFSVVIFCVVLFLYLHITHHLNVSNDLEVYTIERPSKDKLEEICGLKHGKSLRLFHYLVIIQGHRNFYTNSSRKLSYRLIKRSTSYEYLLYAITAGIAANKPIAVATKASLIPGATIAIVACCTVPNA